MEVKHYYANKSEVIFVFIPLTFLSQAYMNKELYLLDHSAMKSHLHPHSPLMF